jgi:hypothetical protein
MRWIVAVFIACASVGARAGYAQMAPPAGFTQAGSAFTYGGSAAANAPFVGGSAAAQVTTNVGGRVVTMAAPMRLAANAASFAVAAIRLTPSSLAVGVVATWLATYGLAYVDGVWTKSTAGPASTWYAIIGGNHLHVAAGQGQALCSMPYGPPPGGWTFTSSGSSTGIVGWCGAAGAHTVNVVNEACSAHVPPVLSCGSGVSSAATEADWVAPAAATLSDDVANAIRPFVPLPVVQPWAPPNPLPVPVRVPIAEPVPLPGTDPQRYRQPVETVKPAPLPDMPFRYDQQPGWLEGESPVGLVDPTPVGESDPVPTPGAPVELETCGLPDTPECVISGKGVESGSADQKFANQKSAMDTAGDDIKGKIDNPTKPTSLAWGFTSGLFGIPAASCQPFSWGSRLGAVTVDVCNNSLVNTMRGMLAWMMYALTLLYVWRRANESLERTA